MPSASVFQPILQASNHFPIDASEGDVDIKAVSPRGEGACALYVANDDASACTITVWLADQDPTDDDQDPIEYTVPSGTFLPLLVRMVVQAPTADTVIGLIGRGSGR